MLLKKVCYELAKIRHHESITQMVGEENNYIFWNLSQLKSPISVGSCKISTLRKAAKCLDVTPEFIVRIIKLSFIGGKGNGNNPKDKRGIMRPLC